MILSSIISIQDSQKKSRNQLADFEVSKKILTSMRHSIINLLKITETKSDISHFPMSVFYLIRYENDVVILTIYSVPYCDRIVSLESILVICWLVNSFNNRYLVVEVLFSDRVPEINTTDICMYLVLNIS